MRSTRRIALLLTLVFLLPALFFSVYEISSLDRNEKMIQEIYAKQLDAVLFSANQYADDIINNWASRIETGFQNQAFADSTPGKIRDLLVINGALHGVVLFDSVPASDHYQLYTMDENQILPSNELKQIVHKSDSLISQLLNFRKSGFQKIERIPLDATKYPNINILAFVVQISASSYRVASMVIDTELFVQDVVGPRLQQIAKDQVVLYVIRGTNNRPEYTTLLEPVPSLPEDLLTSEFWIFPEYRLGIQGKGVTISDLVKERTRTNIFMLIGLDVILIVAVWLVFRNLKREVDLAQNKSDFVSNVSHEIRTPLALISMFAEMLDTNRVASEEKRKEYYTIINKETQRLTGIVNKILSFSQTDAKKKTLHPEVLHVDTEINSVLNTYDFHLSNKGFKYSYSGSVALHIMADKGAFTECLINLIDNAIKYSDERRELEIHSGQQGQSGFVTVRDNGIGINDKDLKHIFDKFYRVPKGDLARTRGTGLGLSLVKQLMQDQGGDVKVQSEPGTGSEFTLFFPLANNR